MSSVRARRSPCKGRRFFLYWTLHLGALTRRLRCGYRRRVQQRTPTMTSSSSRLDVRTDPA